MEVLMARTVNIGGKAVGLWKLITAAIAAVLVLLLIIGLKVANDYNQEAVNRETQLSNQYRDNQNELSSYISTFYEQVGVANLKSSKMDQILLDAVKGRYEGKTSAQPGNGQLFSAIVEQYPQLDLKVYDKIQDTIASGRTAYKNKQSALLDMLRSYDNWRKGSIFRKAALNMWGVPTDSLVARWGNHKVTGEKALDKMYDIVLTSQANDAYDTGTMDPLSPPK
jgi:hypothetical protein